jgi:hypothetical protein
MDRSAQYPIDNSPSCAGLVINNARLSVYIVYCVVLVGCYALSLSVLPDSSQTAALTIAYAIGAIVPCCAIFRRELDLLEPIYWFSAMYFAFFVGAVYFILTDFQYAQHNLVDDLDERNRTLRKALSLVLIGYLVFLGGYLVATMYSQRARINFDGDNHVPDWLIASTVVALLALGLLNFTYLIANYPGGLLKYYSEMGLRQHRLEAYGEGVTTAGLQLIYAGVILWLFMLMRKIRRGVSVAKYQIAIFTVLSISSAAVLASQGRLFQTVSYCLVLAGMVYAFSDGKRRNPVMLLSGAGLVMCGLGLFFGRLLSLLIYNRPEVLTSLGWSGVVDTFFRALGRFVLDSGNVTDLTSLMNIIAFWEQDFSYLYGMSFLSPLSRFIGGVEFQSIAELTQPHWSTGVGAWPPTFVGELYANFGAVGVVGGMLIAGFLMGRAYVYLARWRGFWATLILCALTFRFFLVLPKGETVNLAGSVWIVLPALAIFGALKLVSVVARQPNS